MILIGLIWNYIQILIFKLNWNIYFLNCIQNVKFLNYIKLNDMKMKFKNSIINGIK